MARAGGAVAVHLRTTRSAGSAEAVPRPSRAAVGRRVGFRRCPGGGLRRPYSSRGRDLRHPERDLRRDRGRQVGARRRAASGGQPGARAIGGGCSPGRGEHRWRAVAVRRERGAGGRRRAQVRSRRPLPRRAVRRAGGALSQLAGEPGSEQRPGCRTAAVATRRACNGESARIQNRRVGRAGRVARPGDPRRLVNLARAETWFTAELRRLLPLAQAEPAPSVLQAAS